MESVRHRANAMKRNLKSKTKKTGWILPQQSTSFGDENTYSNIDLDVTPLERRTWTAWTILGFWLSDALCVQSWSAASAIIAVGLTWREAVYCLIIGAFTVSIPLALNAAAGANLHIPFPVLARSSFGFYFSRFAIVIRMTTALFWHAIQTYSGSTAMTQVIRAIWPSYLDIPNHLPKSAGITSQQMVSHFLFWSVQFPVLLIPPHKLKWFFVFKAVIVLVACVGTVIGMTQLAGGTGDIFKQEPLVHGWTKAWLICSSMSSITGGWATMATNVADFSRYLRKSKAVYWQIMFVPLIMTSVGVFGIIATSCSKVTYGEYIWDPLALASHWNGAGGRAAAFFVGVAWCVAQIGTNLSANVISFANDAVSLCPKYISIRRGAIVCTVIAGWVMVPWKIISSAASLLSFMAALGIFLAPIAAMLASDYWLVKRKAIDVPGLYHRDGRYSYGNKAKANWRAAVALLIGVVPNLPGMIHAVNDKINIGGGKYTYDIFYLYGFTSTLVVYWALSAIWPARDTLVAAVITEEVKVIDGVEHVIDGVHDYSEKDVTVVEEHDVEKRV